MTSSEDVYTFEKPYVPSKDTEIWIGNKMYSCRRTWTDEFLTNNQGFHSVTIQNAFNKKEVAMAIGLRMIADGCIKVETWYDIETMSRTYMWVARPFSKKRLLP